MAISLKVEQYEISVFSLFYLTLVWMITFPIVVNASSKKILPLQKIPTSESKVVLSHFNHLYTEIEIEGRKMGVVKIYSLYPDYTYATEPAEGFTCVDDVARAMVMLSNYLQVQHDEKVLHKLKMLIRFVLYMQNTNGYFNNFMWQDLSINTSYKTSVAELNWWSLRALWGLQVASKFVQADKVLVDNINQATDRLVNNIKREIPLSDINTEIINTLEIASWLPNKYAADQAALAIIGLLPYYKKHKDHQVLEIINLLAKGIIQMQKGDAKNYPYGMFLSWKNLWHAWGNSQAYALMLAGQQLDRQEYIQSALLEIDYFYPYLLNNGFAESISIQKQENNYIETSKKRFPQIAYGIRPMVYAASEAFKVTKNNKYRSLQDKLTSWFFANNDATQTLYDQTNGRTFDAIDSEEKVNKNSGAESTIEALLVLQKIPAGVNR